jgi:hypothetical protein
MIYLICPSSNVYIINSFLGFEGFALDFFGLLSISIIGSDDIIGTIGFSSSFYSSIIFG